VNSWRNSPLEQVLSQQSNGAENAQFHGGDGDTESLGHFLLGPFLDERENCRDAKARRQASKCLRGLDADLGGDAGIDCGCSGKIGDLVSDQFSAGPAGTEPVECRVGSDAASPGPKGTRQVETSVGAMNAPKSFDRKILRGCGIANDFENPRIDGPLILAKEHFEGVEIALPKPVK
jgi:hypothetical protein